MQELETFSNVDECRIERLLLSNTTINIQFKDISRDDVKTNVGLPQGDATSVTFFNIAFENSLRSLREAMNKRKPDIEHSYSQRSSLLKELIYPDDSDFPTEERTFEKYSERRI